MAGRRIAQLVVGIMLGSGIFIPISLLLITGPAASKSERASPVLVSSCHDRLLKDWQDGRIDGAYPVACYRKAIKELPTDLRVYSSAPDDIRQALSQRLAQGIRKP
jgi:hypothetical protein